MDEETVITPGGPRPMGKVHIVKPGQVIHPNQPDFAVKSGIAVSSKKAKASAMNNKLVLTPGGFRHPSLVHRIEPGHALNMAEGRPQLMNMKSKKFTAITRATVKPAEVPALGSGWIAYAYWNNPTSNPVSNFTTKWTVPPSPSASDGQVIFLFNGIQNFGTNYGILQPVLQWGVSAAGGGAYWSIASWYVTSGGDAFHTNLIQVNAGDTLTGVMKLKSKSGSFFSYTSEFTGIADTTLTVNDIAQLLWCNETLEAYRIDQCTDYPNTTRTAFRNIAIKTGNVTPTLNWTPVNQVTDCGQYAEVISNSATTGEVDIHYRQSRSKFDLDFLRYIDPLLLWLFKHGWEDPGWGRNQEAQSAILRGVQVLADQITDKKLRAEIRQLATKALARAQQNRGER